MDGVAQAATARARLGKSTVVLRRLVLSSQWQGSLILSPARPCGVSMVADLSDNGHDRGARERTEARRPRGAGEQKQAHEQEICLF